MKTNPPLLRSSVEATLTENAVTQMIQMNEATTPIRSLRVSGIDSFEVSLLSLTQMATDPWDFAASRH
jgi:hypothetical protein